MKTLPLCIAAALFTLPAHAMSTSLSGGYTCLAPDVYDATVSVPAGDKLLIKDTIHYVDGDVITVTIRSSSCSTVSSVTVAGSELDTAYDPIEGGNSWVEITTVAIDALYSVHTITIHKDNSGAGVSPEVVVTIADQVYPDSTGTFRFLLAQVAGINNGTVPLTRTEAQLQNEYIASIYGRFGDDGRWTTEDGEVLRDPDYAQMNMTPEADGIHVNFKADVDNWIGPTLVMSGRFHFDLDTQGFFMVWDEPITGTLDNWVPDGQAVPAAAMFQAILTEEVTAQFPDCGALPCYSLFSGVDHAAGKVIFNWQETLDDSVEIHVPYDTNRMYQGATHGLAVPAGEEVAIAVGGTVSACVNVTNPATCTRHEIDAAGLFSWDYAPVPEADRLTEFNIWVHEEERAEARAALHGFARDTSLLHIEDDNVGALYLRTDDGDPITNLTAPEIVELGNGPCKVRALGDIGDAPTTLSLSPNDYPHPSYGELGTGTYTVRVDFAQAQELNAILAGMPSCASHGGWMGGDLFAQ